MHESPNLPSSSCNCGGGLPHDPLFAPYALPLIIFLLLAFAMQLLTPSLAWDHPDAAWWQRDPGLILYPLQCVVCGGVLWKRRAVYRWDATGRSLLWATILGIVGITCWLLPYFAGWIDASEGFAPQEVFGEGHWATYAEFSIRILRAVLIVPLVEEFFWRGYFMRWAVNSDAPQEVPMGTPSWKGYCLTTVGFMLIHPSYDYAGAFIFGSLVYLLTVKTRALMPAVVMHAVANAIMVAVALLGGYPGLL